MKKNYCIPSFKDFNNPNNYDLVQFTLNQRIHPSARNTISMISSTCRNTPVDFVVHYDYTYIISRYRYFNESTRRAIIRECFDIMQYSSTNDHCKGIVMHTDFPIAKDCYKNGYSEQALRDHYSASLWDTDRIVDSAKDSDKLLENVLWDSLTAFYVDYKIYSKINNGSKSHCKILLENTTKVGPNMEGSLDSLVEYLTENPEVQDLYGLCLDTEHDYAVSGEYRTTPYIEELHNSISTILVHLNTVPEEVQPGSKKDRHSNTTICECSVHTPGYYNTYTNRLDDLGILWIREIKDETIKRELEQLCQ